MQKQKLIHMALCLSKKKKKKKIMRKLYIYILKNYVTIHLRLIYMDVLEIAILLISCQIEYVFQTKQKILIQAFSTLLHE